MLLHLIILLFLQMLFQLVGLPQFDGLQEQLGLLEVVAHEFLLLLPVQHVGGLLTQSLVVEVFALFLHELLQEDG